MSKLAGTIIHRFFSFLYRIVYKYTTFWTVVIFTYRAAYRVNKNRHINITIKKGKSLPCFFTGILWIYFVFAYCCFCFSFIVALCFFFFIMSIVCCLTVVKLYLSLGFSFSGEFHVLIVQGISATMCCNTDTHTMILFVLYFV